MSTEEHVAGAWGCARRKANKVANGAEFWLKPISSEAVSSHQIEVGCGLWWSWVAHYRCHACWGDAVANHHNTAR